MGVKAEVTGVKELDAKFRRLTEKVERKLMRAALAAQGRVVVKAIKKEIPSTWKEGRKAIGSRVQTGKRAYKGQVFAKAGVGVGLSKKTREKAPAPRAGRKGVGIGAQNFHWFVEGTAERFTGSKRVGAHRRGVVNKRVATGNPVRRTGRLKKNPVVRRGFAASASTAIQAFKDNLSTGIQREWAKR